MHSHAVQNDRLDRAHGCQSSSARMGGRGRTSNLERLAVAVPVLDAAAREKLWHGLAWLLILGTAAARLVYLAWFCPLDLAPDEAHYWDWSRHRDWSYYSKGPLVAVLIRLSCWLTGSWSEYLVGSQMLAVRLPAVICGCLLMLSLYLLIVQIYRHAFLALLAVAAASTLPLLAAGSILMTIDAPYTCCWGWALLLAYLALFRHRCWAWPLLGLVVGLGVLAKYTMVLFFPSLGLFLLFTPAYRRELLRPGPWLAVGLAVLCCLPILYWNMQHGWVSFWHVRQQAGLPQNTPAVCWLGPLVFLGCQFALLLGFWFIGWLRAIWDMAPWRAVNDAQRYLWWLSLPMFLCFLLFGFTTGGGQPNWPVTAYLSGLVLTVGWMQWKWQTAGMLEKRAMLGGSIATALAGLALTLTIHHSEITYPLLARLAGPPTAKQALPLRRLDPTCRLRGWRELARQVDQCLQQLRQRGIEPVMAAEDWTIPGELGLYCQDHPQVCSVGLALGKRHSQYDFWRPNPIHDPQKFLGRTFIYVGYPNQLIQQGAFACAESTTLVVHQERGHAVARWYISVLHGFRGFAQPEQNANY